MADQYNYAYARPLGSFGGWEKVVDDDFPLNEDGSPAGPPDVFKLENSGWHMWVEFMPLNPEAV